MESEEITQREGVAARPDGNAESERPAELAEREGLERGPMGRAEVQMPALGLEQLGVEALQSRPKEAQVQQEQRRRKKYRPKGCALPEWSGCRGK